jgi:hypothetical protein
MFTRSTRVELTYKENDDGFLKKALQQPNLLLKFEDEPEAEPEPYDWVKSCLSERGVLDLTHFKLYRTGSEDRAPFLEDVDTKKVAELFGRAECPAWILEKCDVRDRKFVGRPEREGAELSLNDVSPIPKVLLTDPSYPY